MRWLAVLAALTVAAPATAQEVSQANAAVFRWLDKVSGVATDVEVPAGQEVTEGRLLISLRECRYPTEDPSSNAYAYLVVQDQLYPDSPVFEGWMIADSPALSALDHSRYDLWLLRCVTP
ncbi:DUF2155 domain-containing protein [Halodurantibacterium flavum]|uniref:DUF2155 domain-containing protein n=2 Tax=Halodurantibacterium flavum TaxID=1382802 RepID=A0ABW4SB99_9RHOB